MDRCRAVRCCPHDGPGHAGHGPRPIDQVLRELEDLTAIGVPRADGRHPHRQAVLGIEAERDARQPYEAVDEQSGSDQQHERHRDLGDDQRVS